MLKKILLLLFTSVLSLNLCYSQSWVGSDKLRLKCITESRYDSALYYADDAAAIVRGTTGENNLQYARMLDNLAVAHFYLGNYKKAKYYILQEEQLREELKATSDTAYIGCLRIASIICRRSGSYEEALTQIKKAERKSQSFYGFRSPEYAGILASYAGVYHDLGCSVNDMVYINLEEKYLKMAEDIYNKAGDKSKFEAAINRSDLAALNNNIGNSPRAEDLLVKVAEFYKRENGSESSGYASSLNNLAVLYYNTGNYKLAEKFFVEAVAIFTKIKESGKINAGICINNLGALYNEIGNYKAAEKLIADAKKIFEADSEQNNPAFAVVLNNLASIYLSEEYYASPENKNRDRLFNTGKLLLKSDSIFRLNCGKPHPYDQAITTNLAIWYNLTGDTKKSVKLMNDLAYDSNITLRVVSLMKKMSISAQLPDSRKEDHLYPEPVIIPVTVKLMDQISASNAANNNSIESDGVTRALIKLIMGKATNLKKAVGIYHPAYAEVLRSLIVMYGANDDATTEEELSLEYIDVINHKTLQDFSFLSESEKEMYYQTRLPDMHSFIAYSLLRKRKNPSITRYAYNNILLNKGLMLKSSTAMRLAILNSNNQALLKEYDDWISLQKEISVLYSTPIEMRTKDVSELEVRANALEKNLVSGSQDFSDYRKGLQITWDDVRKSLKPDEAAIEFTDYKTKEKDGGDAVIYCALILRSDSEYPEMIRLFTEDQLKAVINKNGTNNIYDINDIYGSGKKGDDRLYNLIWKPVETYLKGIKNVFISPSGLLYKVSFPAIGNGKDIYLCDRYQIQIKGSTGNSYGQNLFTRDNHPSAMIFGGIQYSQNNTDDQVWTYLEGTKSEGNAISNILQKGNIETNYLTDNKATETYFKQNASKYNVLHIATHGFFFADPNEVRFQEKKQEVEYGQVTFRGNARGFGVSSFVNNENPLMRSGLVLAGANNVWTKTEKGDTDDGVLTAQEVTQIDLRKNDLVVLSACETGLGDIKGSEGVYGLQRALKMAGVKNIIMSLWDIPDKETVEFMGDFYTNLLNEKDIREAFYEAQKIMRTKYDPYYWGAFVLME